MAIWTDEFLMEVREALGRISRIRDERDPGKLICHFCGSTDIGISQRPMSLEIGDDRPPGRNVLFAVYLKCPTCGHLELFDSELFRGPDEPVMRD